MKIQPSPILSHPSIDPVAPGVHRPFWSVMVPTYKRIDFLEQTLRSILRQDSGPERMQIEVVDNCSPGPQVEELVQRLGKGRIVFFRQPENCGMIGNWNTCLARSTGEWVHILHDDDEVSPGFYATYEELIAQYPQAVVGGGAAILMNEAGVAGGISHQIFWNRPGPIPDFLAHCAIMPRFAPTAIVARRSAYEAVGGFTAELRYCPDWEMVFRLARHGEAIGTIRPFCLYREHSSNTTLELAASGVTLREQILLVDRQCASLAPRDVPPGKKRYALIAADARHWAVKLALANKWRACLKCFAASVQLGSRPREIARLCLSLLRVAVQRLVGRTKGLLLL